MSSLSRVAAAPVLTSIGIEIMSMSDWNGLSSLPSLSTLGMYKSGHKHEMYGSHNARNIILKARHSLYVYGQIHISA